jgi:hypothetical protein
MTEAQMESDFKPGQASHAIWVRGLYMILFFFLYEIAEVVIGAVAVLQFLIVLFSGNRNGRMLQFGRQLSAYSYEVFLFQTFNTETKPFPFSDWPKGEEAPKENGNGGKREVAALESPPPEKGG